jgi:hypothetical protein
MKEVHMATMAVKRLIVTMNDGPRRGDTAATRR